MLIRNIVFDAEKEDKIENININYEKEEST